MKPTRGRVPSAPLGEGWLGLSVFGALARTVGDSALLLSVMAADESLAAAPATPPRRLRIAISRKVPPGLLARLSRDQALAFDRTARLLAELGHDVIERDPAYGMGALEFTQTWLRGIREDFAKLPPGAPVERSTRQMAAAGRLITPARRDRLLARRAHTTARILGLWEHADVLLTPGLSRTALPAEAAYGRAAPVAFDTAGRFTPWTPPFNLTGQPALALPAGFGADGLPTSVQLVARPGEEGLLYALAAQIETARPWSGSRPPLAEAV
jgi:amidase